MALTRKLLTGMGLTAEQVDTIIEAHTETVDALKTERDSFKEDAGKYAATSKELADLKAAAKDSGGDAFKVKYEAIKSEFEDYKKAQTEKETRAAKEHAFREILKAANVNEKRVEAIVKVSGSVIDEIKLKSDGKVENEETLSNNIKTEWADFISTSKETGAAVPNPPASGGTPDYDNMSDEEYYKATIKKG